MKEDEDLGAGAVPFGDGLEAGGVDEVPLRLKARQLLHARADQHVAAEEAVPGELVDDADGDAKLGIHAPEKVLDVHLFPFQVVGDPVVEGVEVFRLERSIDLAPPDIRFGSRLSHHELVLGRAAGVGPGLYDHRTVFGDHPFALPNDFLIQLRLGQILQDFAQVGQAHFTQLTAHAVWLSVGV